MKSQLLVFDISFIKPKVQQNVNGNMADTPGSGKIPYYPIASLFMKQMCQYMAYGKI